MFARFSRMLLTVWFCLLTTVFLVSGVCAQTAGVFKLTAPNGTTNYLVLLNSAGLPFNPLKAGGAGFDAAFADANWTSTKYCLPLTQQGTSQIWLGSMPAAVSSAGRYTYLAFQQAGANPAEGDLLIGSGTVDWSGSAISTVANLGTVSANVTQIGGVTAQATAGAASVTFPTVWTDPWATALPGAYANGTAGKILGSGGGGGGGSDPWATVLPGAYASGTAGYLVGNLVNSIFSHPVEANVTLQQALEIIAAYCGGNVNTGSHIYSAIGNPATVRLTYIIDPFGNRNFTISP